MTRTCYSYDRRFWLRDRHLDGCDGECAGCEPCPDHCGCRRGCPEHLDPAHPITAPACVGRTRADLATIVDASALMLPEAIVKGVDSEAANLAGPAADPEAWSWHRVSALEGRVDHVSLEEDDDTAHPVSVLGRWAYMIRDAYGHTADELATVTRCADYLDGLLTQLAQDAGQDWPTFAGEVRACRTRLEAVLHDSRRPETGAPCPRCAEDDDTTPPPLVLQRNEGDVSGASDRWTCPRCRARWSIAEYRLRVGTEYLLHADRLTASQLHAAYRIKPATIRKWAERGRVAKRGRNAAGQQLYDVADARAARDHDAEVA